MENMNPSERETRALKSLSQYKKPSMAKWMWVIRFATLLIWVRHWNQFTQSWTFCLENAVVWFVFNYAVYFNVKYNPVVYDLIQRLSAHAEPPKAGVRG